MALLDYAYDAGEAWLDAAKARQAELDAGHPLADSIGYVWGMSPDEVARRVAIVRAGGVRDWVPGVADAFTQARNARESADAFRAQHTPRVVKSYGEPTPRASGGGGIIFAIVVGGLVAYAVARGRR